MSKDQNTSAMKKPLLFTLLILTLMSSCADEPGYVSCEVPATVRNLAGLDGCGWVFELSDGTKLIPYWPWFCGTPPLPKAMTDDPLYNFDYVEGKVVLLNYELMPDISSICMAGPVVKITCLSERVLHTNE